MARRRNKKEQQQQPQPRHRAYIFGVANSPWTQTAVLAAEAKGICYDLHPLVAAQPGVIATNGLIMPTLVITDENGSDRSNGTGASSVREVVAGSFAIMEALDRLVPNRFPFGLPSSGAGVGEARRHQGKLEELFFEGAFERFYPLPRKLFQFPYVFAQQPMVLSSGQAMPTLRGRLSCAVLKAFLMLKFGCFLCAGAASCHLFGLPRIQDAAAVDAQLSHWEAMMAGGEDGVWLTTGEGRSDEDEHDHRGPSYLDLALFAQLQMIFTGLSPSLAARVASRPKYVAFMAALSRALPDYAATNYCREALHGGADSSGGGGGSGGGAAETLTPPGRLQRASGWEVAVTLAVATFLVSPLGWLPALAFFVYDQRVRRRKGEASGKKLDPSSKWGQVFGFLDLPLRDQWRCVVGGDRRPLEALTQRRLARWRRECEPQATGGGDVGDIPRP